MNLKEPPVRYVGYSSSIGEALRPIIHPHVVDLSKGATVAYALIDIIDKTSKQKNTDKVGLTAMDTFLWELCASVIIPRFAINRITWLSRHIVRYLRINGSLGTILPTAIGLISIPILVKQIDDFVDLMLNETFRKISG